MTVSFLPCWVLTRLPQPQDCHKPVCVGKAYGVRGLGLTEEREGLGSKWKQRQGGGIWRPEPGYLSDFSVRVAVQL